MKKKRIYTPEQKARHKITTAIWRKNNPDYKQTFTPEQEAKRKITRAIWVKNNPRTDYYKEWHKANPDYSKEWHRANPEKKKACDARWHKANPNYHRTRRAYDKALRESHNLEGFQVYAMPNMSNTEYYCGQTQNPCYRDYVHKSAGIYDITKRIVLATTETRVEALEIEAYYHTLGFLGANHPPRGI